jgi:hypothetical protein
MARPAAGAASCPAGGTEQSVFERSMPSDVICGVGDRFAVRKRVKKGSCASRGSVFLAKRGGARYQVRAFSAPLLNAAVGPPQ